MRSRVASAHRRHEEILARTPHNLGVGIVAAQRDRFERSFARAVVQLEEPGLQGTLQCLPMVQRILDRFADRALGQDLGQLGFQPGVELVKDRPRPLSSQFVPQPDERLVVCRLSLLGVAFHVIQEADPCQRLMRPWRVAGPRLVELSPRVHHAADLDDVTRFVQPIVGRIGVGLEITLEVLEDLVRAGGTAVRRVAIDHVRMVVVADGDPKPAGLDSLAVVVLHRHRRVVVLDDLGGEDLAQHQLDDRIQQLGDRGHPVAHRRP
jgi:hypothetical protein